MADKYYRLVTFVVNICPKPLRALFLSKAESDPDPNHHYTSIDSYLNFRKSDIGDLRRTFKIHDDQFNLIYPSNGMVDLEQWDVTLLNVLLKNLFPALQQKKEWTYVQEIINVRNSLQHIANIEFITDDDFISAWSCLKDAVLGLKQWSGSTTLDKIEDEMALVDNNATLGDVRNTWLKLLYSELKCQNSELQLKYSELLNEVKELKKTSMKSKRILTKASVATKGRSGVPEKRMKIVDKEIDRMRDKLGRALSEENDCKQKLKLEISKISQQLADNHRVIVTGFDDKITYKCALAAIQEQKNVRPDQCLEVSNPSDWKRICADDAKVVLFREPFGVSTYDCNKVEVMCEEFDSMIQATDDDNDDIIDIIIVSNQRRLNDVIKRNDHDMLSPSSTVYIGSTTDNTIDDSVAPDDVVHRNILDMSKMLKKAHVMKPVDKKANDKAKQVFINHSIVVIVGPAESGKTSLSFDLLSSYDLSNGEENFLVISNPSELKYVRLSLHPVIIIKSFCGLRMDTAKAWEWYSEFDRLYAAVHENQVGVIITIDSKVYRKIPSAILKHPVLKHTVNLPCCYADGSDGSNEDTNECGVQTDNTSSELLPLGNNPTNDAMVDEHHQLRSVKSVREHNIKKGRRKCVISSVAILPSGKFLLINIENDMILKLDENYHVIFTLDVNEIDIDMYIDEELACCCYIGNDTVAACFGQCMIFLSVKDGLSVENEFTIQSACESLTYYGDNIYVVTDDTVDVYSTIGEFRTVLYTLEDTPEIGYYASKDIAVSNDGSKVYLIYRRRDIFYNPVQLVTIDSSGNHLFTLQLPNIQCHASLCVDDQGFVIINGRGEEVSTQCLIQVSPNGRRCYGTIYQFPVVSGNSFSLRFNSHNNALVLHERGYNKIRVFELR